MVIETPTKYHMETESGIRNVMNTPHNFITYHVILKW